MFLSLVIRAYMEGEQNGFLTVCLFLFEIRGSLPSLSSDPSSLCGFDVTEG